MLFITTRINAEVATIAYPVSWGALGVVQFTLKIHFPLLCCQLAFRSQKRKKPREKASLLSVPVTELEASTKLQPCDHAEAFAPMRACATTRTVRSVTHPNCVTRALLETVRPQEYLIYKLQSSVPFLVMCSLRITSCYPLSEMINLRANVSLSEGKWKSNVIGYQHVDKY